MSRKGNPYDNAIMESFYRTLKRELVRGANYDTPEQAQMDIFKYIEIYYNTKRLELHPYHYLHLGYHSCPSYLSRRNPIKDNSIKMLPHPCPPTFGVFVTIS